MTTKRASAGSEGSDLPPGERRHRDLLSPIIDQLPDFGVCILDPDGVIVSVSNGVTEFLGYQEQELIGQHAAVLFTAEDRAGGLLRREMDAARHDGQAANRRWGVRKDGGRVFVDGRLLALYNADGALEGFAKVMRDVTESMQAEQALRDSELRYRTLFDAIDEGFCIIEMFYNRSGRPAAYSFLETNPAFDEHTAAVGAARGAPQLAEAEEEFWFKAALRVLETGELVRFEARTASPPRWLDVRAWRLGSEEGTQVAVVFSDVTERKTFEAGLRASEVRYRVLFDLIPVAVYVCDAEGVIQEFNQRAVELWGRAPAQDDPAERYCGSFKLHRADGSAMPHEQSPMARVLRGETPDAGEFELRVERPDGTLRSVMALPRAIKDENGEITGAINSLYDLTERTRSEELLRALNEALERMVQERTDELRSSQVRFQQAFDVGPVAACITSLDEDRILEVNRSFGKLTGYAADEVIGRTADELQMWSSVEDRATLAGGIEVGGGEGYNELRMELRTKSGAVRDILASGEQIRMDTQSAWLKMFIDVTDRKRTQEELMKAIEEVMSDASWFSGSVVKRLADLRKPVPAAHVVVDFTRRERQVLEQMARGRGDTEIAEELGIARLTVRNYVASIYSKIDVHSRSEAVVWARERGMIA